MMVMRGTITDFRAFFGIRLAGKEVPPYLQVWIKSEDDSSNYANVTWQIKKTWPFDRLSMKIVAQLTESVNKIPDFRLIRNRKEKLIIPHNIIQTWVKKAKIISSPKITIQKKYNFGWLKNWLEERETGNICDHICFVRDNESIFLKSEKCIKLSDIHRLNKKDKKVFNAHAEKCQFCDFKLFLLSLGEYRDRQLTELGFDPYDQDRGFSEEEIENLVS